MTEELLSVKELRTCFYTRQGTVKAVDGVTFDLRKGEIFGLVGESGCGKSVTALSIMRLVSDPPGRISGGKILLEGQDILAKSREDMRRIRGERMSMIFQDPTSSLNPIMKIGDQIVETILEHKEVSKSEAKKKAIGIMHSVGIPNASLRFHEYPFEFSGGMRQRAMIAIAISCSPSLLIADEPTTNLDVTVQAQTLELIKGISEKEGISVLLITHNLGLVAWLCGRIAVMYAGKIVERASTHVIFKNALHPYTRALLECIPRISGQGDRRLKVIKGRVPNLVNMPSGCRFQPRCPYAIDRCLKEEPDLVEIEKDHWVSCFLSKELSEK
jgi:oligopeptide/dipeptide ABC transporter ATP-binding protein